MSRVRATREKLRVEFSQHRLAKLTGISQTRISLIERELVDPKPEERVGIAQALDCPVAVLWPEDEQEAIAAAK